MTQLDSVLTPQSCYLEAQHRILQAGDRTDQFADILRSQAQVLATLATVPFSVSPTDPKFAAALDSYDERYGTGSCSA